MSLRTDETKLPQGVLLQNQEVPLSDKSLPA